MYRYVFGQFHLMYMMWLNTDIGTNWYVSLCPILSELCNAFEGYTMEYPPCYWYFFLGVIYIQAFRGECLIPKTPRKYKWNIPWSSTREFSIRTQTVLCHLSSQLQQFYSFSSNILYIMYVNYIKLKIFQIIKTSLLSIPTNLVFFQL